MTVAMGSALDHGLLFFLSLCELGALAPYIRRLGPPRSSLPRRLGLYLAAAGANFLLLCFCREDFHDVYYIALYSLIVAGLLLCCARVHYTLALWHTMAIILTTAILKAAYTSALRPLAHSLIIYAQSERLWFRLLSSLGLFILDTLALGLLSRYTLRPGRRRVNKRSLITALLFTAAMLALNSLSADIFMRNRDPYAVLSAADTVYITLYDCICAIAGALFLIGMDMAARASEQEMELTQIRLLMESQARQYSGKKEAEFGIQSKYHDLKNHINALEHMEGAEARREYIGALKASLKRYEAFCATGNGVLDALLNEKLMACAEKDIRLLLLMDSQALDAIAPVDLVSIFGNAIDNAIEATEALDPGEPREITVRTLRVDTWLVCRFENRYKNAPREEGGRLVSTKGPEEIHGVGMSCIRYAAEKYGGHCTHTAEKGRFVLDIALPAGKG